MPRTLILLHSYKAYPKGGNFGRTAPRTVLELGDGTYYGNALHGDCYVVLARRWLEAGYVDAVKGVAIQYPEGHARWSPAGVYPIAPGFDFHILETIEQYDSVHTPSPDDVLFIRGHPPWEPIVERHAGSFKVFYCSTRGLDRRPRYPVDVVLTDDTSWAVPATPCVEMVKCCDEEVFRPLGRQRTYDVCFIARFDRRDQKGQLQFARLANKRWRAVFAGEHAEPVMVDALRRRWPACEIRPEISKTEVNELLNRSKVSVVFSSADEPTPRIVLESLAAGTPVLIHARSVARKYIGPAAGVVTGTLGARWRLARMLREHGRFDPRGEYERRFASRLVADRLWRALGVDAARPRVSGVIS